MDNFGSVDWSGSGWSSKEVGNEINNIPEDKSPPKYTTKAQPRTHTNVENEFHYQNNIENHVEVDDFYYDYNFINFHEELSDDFESDGRDLEDGHRFSSPQEAEPTLSVKGNSYMDSTRAPTVISADLKATGHSLRTEKPQNTKVDNAKDSRNVVTKESVQTHSEDFLSEDFLLPVFTTRSPPVSAKRHSQTHKGNDANVSLRFTTQTPTQDVKWGQQVEEAENNYDGLSEEGNDSEDATVTPLHAAHTPRHQTTISTIISTTIHSQETDTHYNYDYSTASEYIDTPEPLSSPPPETIHQVKVQLDENVSEIPQTTSRTTASSVSFTLEDQTDLNTAYATSEPNSWDTVFDLSTASSPVSEESTPLPIPSLIISGNQEAAIDSTSLTGTETTPPTHLEGATLPPPAGSLVDTSEQGPTEPAFTDTTGTETIDFSDYDYNEIIIPPMVSSDPGSTYKPLTSTAAAPQHSETPLQHTGTPAVPILPTHPPILSSLSAPTSVQTTASTQVTKDAHWVVGNWSAVSMHQVIYILVLQASENLYTFKLFFGDPV